MPSETVGSIVNVGVDESVGFSPPFPSTQHVYRFHRIHRIRPFDHPALRNRTVIPTEVGIQDSKSQETVLPDKFLH
ncbi:TPA: hypothetical protein ACWSC9_001455 [Neisseria gonorrhoeae]